MRALLHLSNGLAAAALVLAPAPAQEGAQGAATRNAAAPGPVEGLGGPDEAPGAAPWQPQTPLELSLAAQFGDHSMAVVGDQLLTLKDVQRYVVGPDFEDPTEDLPPGTAPADVMALRLGAAIEQLIKTELKIQGGRNQGYDPELVQRANEAAFQSQLEARGGSVQLSAWLQGFGLDANSFKDYLQDRLLAQFWEDAVTGRSAGAAGRPYVDAFVRPGSLHRRYRFCLVSPDPALGEEIGKAPAMVSMRRLVIGAQDQGGVERARALAEASREFLVSGSGEFDRLVDEYAPEDLKGDGSRVELNPKRIAEYFEAFHPGPEGAEFLASAEPGDLSPVLVFEGQGGSSSFILYRLESRSEGSEARPFVDLETQRSLLEALESERRERRVERGLSELVRSTHVSPLEVRRTLLRADQPR